VIELARTGAGAKAAVSFHGTLTTHDLAAPGTIGARILALTGARDPFASEVDRAAFAAEMTAAGADWHMSLYGSGKHGFTDPIADTMAQHMDGVGYSAFLDRFSWAEATAFLDLCLNGRL
jgi:dienelactone hydrolase